MFRYTDNILTDKDCENIYELVYSSHRAVAQAAGDFLNAKLFSMPLDETQRNIKTKKGKKRAENTPRVRDLVQFFIESEVGFKKKRKEFWYKNPLNPCQYSNSEGGYCFALWYGHSGRHVLPCISGAMNVRPIKLKSCSIHRNCISKMSLMRCCSLPCSNHLQFVEHVRPSHSMSGCITFWTDSGTGTWRFLSILTT